MSDKTPLRGGNPGWAGELGEFAHLTEADVRGSSYAGGRPAEGIEAGGINAYPYQLEQHQPGAPLFEGPYRERLTRILARYPTKQGALLPVLNLAHEIHGYVSPADMDAVARELDLSPAYVRGVATFYTMYNRRPVGRYFIQVCTNVACNLCGADEVLEAFCEHAGVEPGQLSADGLFTVMEAECLGACGFPTAVQVNSQYFENVSAEDVPSIVESLRARGGAGREIAGVPEAIRRTIDVAQGNGGPRALRAGADGEAR
ncbi:MAG TPA: NAD(P)H-dependent oxidoreductase subunit E [Longimicrobiales bacterium]|nr:NAD(P)H-dependent oxidoreductase subunit E [Longimicrobiales bacterium]